MDDAPTVEKKIKSAVTDSEGTIVRRPHRPGVSNLITLYSLVTHTSAEAVEQTFEGQGYAAFKTKLAEHLIEFLTPLQEHIHLYLQDEAQLISILDAGAKKAKTKAEKKMKQVRKAIGIQL